MKDVLDAVHDNRLRIALDVENALDAQNTAAHKAHQQLEPSRQGLLGDGLLDGKAEGANVVVMPVYIMVVVRMCTAVRVRVIVAVVVMFVVMPM